jgi:hypothetical protein
VLHVEFARYIEREKPQRIWAYNALISITTGRPVYSVVLYMTPKPSFPSPFYERQFGNGQAIHLFAFHQIKMWEVAPEVLEQPQLAGLLPLLPLTKNGQNRETFKRMIRAMYQADKLELFPWGEKVAKHVLTSCEDQKWLQKRYKPAKKRGANEVVIEEGKLESCEHNTLLFVELRFPSLLALAKEVIEGELPLQQLKALQKMLFLSNTIEEAQAVLRANE